MQNLYRLRLLLGQDFPPYIYEGSQSIEGTQLNLSITSTFYSLNTLFQPPCFSYLDLHDLRWRHRACWST
jgi:hypothetical protein